MIKNNINKKIINSLISIILTVVIFMTATFVSNRNIPDRWLIKYKFVINEKALIYLNNVDTMMQELRIKTDQDTGLKSYVTKLIETQIVELSTLLNYIYEVKIDSNFIIFKTTDIKNSSNDMSELIKNINVEVKNNLFAKLNLYLDIAKERALEENEYVISQMERISQIERENDLPNSIANDGINLEYYINYLKTKLISSDQEVTIENLQEIFDQLNKNISKNERKEYLNELRNRYAFNGIDSNTQLNQLKKRSEELSNIEIIQNGYIIGTKNLKSPLLQELLIAALLGLAISLLCSYLYLAVSPKKLKKKLTFLLYQEK